MKSEIEQLSKDLEKVRVKIVEIKDSQELFDLKVSYLGKKSLMASLLKKVGGLSVEEKKTLGKSLNQLRGQYEELFNQQEENLKNFQQPSPNDPTPSNKTSSEPLDITLPGRPQSIGLAHPLSQVRDRILDYFNQLGFITVNGSELESDYYNFEALNMPKGHPARDSQDSFYLSPSLVMRTQTSPMQIRSLEEQPPPIAVISPGKVFRRDTLDATHSYCFHQIEGLFIDEGVGFSDLKGLLSEFCHDFFGKELKVRFRPDYFPFTEPSCEISIEYPKKKDGWLEILGAGMVNPLILKNLHIDTHRYTGFAFGIGIERIAMLLHKINDIRLFSENDYCFLQQFSY